MSKNGLVYESDYKISQCTRLLHSGLKKYNPLLFTSVMNWVKTHRTDMGMQRHTFSLSEVDKHILGDLTIEYLGGVIYSISCKDVLHEYTLVEPVVYKGKSVPGTKSMLSNKIRFKIDYLQMCGKF